MLLQVGFFLEQGSARRRQHATCDNPADFAFGMATDNRDDPIRFHARLPIPVLVSGRDSAVNGGNKEEAVPGGTALEREGYVTVWHRPEAARGDDGARGYQSKDNAKFLETAEFRQSGLVPFVAPGRHQPNP
jgi:hypothetical protein